MRTRVAWGLTPLRTPYPSILTYTHQFFLWVTFMNFIRRHGKRFMAGQCLYLDAEKFGAVGTVSALYRHRAYGNVHIEVYPLSRTLLKVGILFWGHPYVGVPVTVDTRL